MFLEVQEKSNTVQFYKNGLSGDLMNHLSCD